MLAGVELRVLTGGRRPRHGGEVLQRPSATVPIVPHLLVQLLCRQSLHVGSVQCPGPERVPVYRVRHRSLVVGQCHADPHAVLRLGPLDVLAHGLLQFSHVSIVDRAAGRQAVLRNG
jgi:hypothetical protein